MNKLAQRQERQRVQQGGYCALRGSQGRWLWLLSQLACK
jgi:hypothetical protein